MMDVLEAIRTRKSVRAFTDQPVSEEQVRQILEVSQRAPSGTNTQPWHTYVCAGAVKDAIIADVLRQAEAGKAAKYEDYDYYPPVWNDTHRDRRRGVGWSLYGLLGIQKGDRERSQKQGLRNFRFFDAPVGLFVTTDAYLARGNWADVGLYLQTIMLAARGIGLHTCPQAAWIQYQEPVFRHLNIPDDQVLVSGMCIGYEDTEAIENTLVSDREEMDEVVQFYGFD